MLVSQLVLPSPCPSVFTSPFSMSVSLYLPYKQVHQYHFSRFHIYVSIFNICFSDLLHSVWQSLGSSTSLQMNHFHFCGWVIFHCIWNMHISYAYVHEPHLLYPFICQWTFRLLSWVGNCKQCCSEHRGTCVFLNYGFLKSSMFFFSTSKFCSWLNALTISTLHKVLWIPRKWNKVIYTTTRRSQVFGIVESTELFWIETA